MATCGSTRWRSPARVAIFGAFLAISCARADDSAIVSADPVAILQLASIDRLLEDVDYLLAQGNVPQYGEVVRGFITALNNLDGLDRRRPLGGMLFIDPAAPDREPQALIYLPLTDVAALRATLLGTGNALESTEVPGTFALRLGQDNLQLLVAGDYALIIDPGKPPPAFRTEKLVHLIDEERTDFDATLTLRRAGIPDAIVSKAVSDLEQQAAQDLARREGESEAEHALRSSVEASLFELIGLVLTEGQDLSAGMQLGAGSPLMLDVEFRSREEGELRRWWGNVLAPPNRLPISAATDAALSWRGAVDLTGRGRDIGRQVLALAHSQLENELGETIPADVRQQLGGVFDALDATVAAGRLESCVEFLPTEAGRFVLLAGAVVEDAAALDAAARTLLPLAEQAGDLQRIDLDAFTAGDLAFHRIEAESARERDRRLYGDDLAVHFAAGEGAVWLAVGGAPTDDVLDTAFSSLPLTQSPPAAALTVRLRPWVDFALREGVARDRPAAELAQSLLPAHAAVTAGLGPSDLGIRLSVNVDEAYVQVLARLAIFRIQKK